MPSSGIELCYNSHEDWKLPYHGKAPSELSHSYYICRVGASLPDLPHFLIIPTLSLLSDPSPIRLPGIAPKAYL